MYLKTVWFLLDRVLLKGTVQTAAAAAAALHHRLASAFPQEMLEVRRVHVDHALWPLDDVLIESRGRGTFPK